MTKEAKWLSEETAIALGYIRRRGGFDYYAVRYGAHTVNEKLRLIRIK